MAYAPFAHISSWTGWQKFVLQSRRHASWSWAVTLFRIVTQILKLHHQTCFWIIACHIKHSLSSHTTSSFLFCVFFHWFLVLRKLDFICFNHVSKNKLAASGSSGRLRIRGQQLWWVISYIGYAVSHAASVVSTPLVLPTMKMDHKIFIESFNIN